MYTCNQKNETTKGNIQKNLDDLAYHNDFLIQHQKHDPWKKELIRWISLKLRTFI